jgi:DNA-binding NarL/FixJ family response regulator
VTDEIRLLLADDYPVVRKGLKASIEEEPSLKVIAEAADGEEALKLIRTLRPQLAVLDIDMPKLDGLGVVKEMAKLKLETKVIFLSFHNDEDIFRAALAAGARGYLLKDSAMQEIVGAIQAVIAGKLYMSSGIALQLLQGENASKTTSNNPLIRDLTLSERRILKLIAEGLSSKEIGDRLSIHYRTVENHRSNMCRKLNIEGANALLRFALQHKEALKYKVNRPRLAVAGLCLSFPQVQRGHQPLQLGEVIFEHVSNGPCRYSYRPELIIVVVGDDDDSGSRIRTDYQSGCGKSVHAGHLNIHEHEIGLISRIKFDGICTVPTFIDLAGLAGYCASYESPNRDIVLNNQKDHSFFSLNKLRAGRCIHAGPHW